jgi:methyl-accepting chemotaxis protein
MKPQKLFSSWFKFAIADFSIAKKISSSYALTIGIAVTGTAIGLLIGNYYQKQAQNRYLFTNQQQRLLGMLSNSVANVRSHPQELFVVLEDSVWLEYEISKFHQDIIQVKTTLSELRRFSSNNPNYIAVGSTEFQEFLSIYERTINAYNQLIQKLWQQIKFPNHQPERISLAKQQIVEAIRGDEATEIKVEFEKLSEGLILIQQSAEQQEEQANEQLNRANILRLQIIAASMVLSTLIAITLALLTSRAIARPVQILTNVAQKSIRESNFDLQVPVTRNDEIGILASSFNQVKRTLI